jgi:hypothetical protein
MNRPRYCVSDEACLNVIPAKAGIQIALGSRLRGSDESL